MARLFNPISVGSWTIRNRIARAPQALNQSDTQSIWFMAARAKYQAWAAGGVGLIMSEPLSIHPQAEITSPTLNHDLLTPALQQFNQMITAHGATFLPVLSYPGVSPARIAQLDLATVIDAFEQAAWRAWAAGCAGVMLDGANRGLLHQLASPLTNQRRDEYGSRGRYNTAIEIVERLRRRFGSRMVIGYRLLVDELRPDGITLQESRVAARQLMAAGVQVFDVTADEATTTPIANFPGWQVPLVSAIRTIVDVPVIASGSLGDPEFAESVLAEGSADIIALGSTLDSEPHWVQRAARELQSILLAS